MHYQGFVSRLSSYEHQCGWSISSIEQRLWITLFILVIVLFILVLDFISLDFNWSWLSLRFSCQFCVVISALLLFSSRENSPYSLDQCIAHFAFAIAFLFHPARVLISYIIWYLSRFHFISSHGARVIVMRSASLFFITFIWEPVLAFSFFPFITPAPLITSWPKIREEVLFDCSCYD